MERDKWEKEREQKDKERDKQLITYMLTNYLYLQIYTLQSIQVIGASSWDSKTPNMVISKNTQ